MAYFLERDPVFAAVEHHDQALLGRQPHVMAAVLADLKILLQVPVEDHFLALGALAP